MSLSKLCCWEVAFRFLPHCRLQREIPLSCEHSKKATLRGVNAGDLTYVLKRADRQPASEETFEMESFKVIHNTLNLENKGWPLKCMTGMKIRHISAFISFLME